MGDWITDLIEETGYLGIAALMFAENVFPPIPSELIMPLAGYAAANGFEVLIAILAGSIGSLAGAAFWYYIGVLVGSDRLKAWARRHGRWLTLTPGDVDKSCRWFNDHGQVAVFFGRLVPTIRTLISIPAGIAEMPLGRFLLYSGVGTVLWTALLAIVGFALKSEYRLVTKWMDPVSNVVLGVLVIGYLFRVVTFRRRDS